MSLSAGLLSAEAFADEQAAMSSGYSDESFSHACASRIFSSMENRCLLSSRGTCNSDFGIRRCMNYVMLTQGLTQIS